MANSRPAFATLNPMALSVLMVLSALNTPPMPTKRFTFSRVTKRREAPFKSGEVAVSVITPSPSTSTSTLRFTMVKLPEASTNPKTSSWAEPDTFKTDPCVPSKSNVITSSGSGPVFTSRGLARKSTNDVLASGPLPVSSVPPPWLMATFRSWSDMVSPSIPTNSARPTLALRAVQVRRSVGSGGGVLGSSCTGLGTFIRARAKFTSIRDRPRDASFSSSDSFASIMPLASTSSPSMIPLWLRSRQYGPLTPTKASTPPMPTVRTSTSTSKVRDWVAGS